MEGKWACLSAPKYVTRCTARGVLCVTRSLRGMLTKGCWHGGWEGYAVMLLFFSEGYADWRDAEVALAVGMWGRFDWRGWGGNAKRRFWEGGWISYDEERIRYQQEERRNYGDKKEAIGMMIGWLVIIAWKRYILYWGKFHMIQTLIH